jgi:colicin import membrane protein
MTTKKNRKYRNTKKKNSNQKDDIVTNLKHFIMSRKLKKAKAKTLSNNRLNLSGGEEKMTLEQIEKGFNSLADTLNIAQNSSKQAKADIASITSEIKTKETEIESAKEEAKAKKISLISTSGKEKDKIQALITVKKEEPESQLRDKVIGELNQKIAGITAETNAEEKNQDNGAKIKIDGIQASISELQKKLRTADIAQTGALRQIQSAEQLKNKYTKAKKNAIAEQAKKDAFAKTQAKAAAKAEAEAVAKAAKEKADAKAATEAAAKAAKDAEDKEIEKISNEGQRKRLQASQQAFTALR